MEKEKPSMDPTINLKESMEKLKTMVWEKVYVDDDFRLRACECMKTSLFGKRSLSGLGQR